MAMDLHWLSGGRLILGIGAGCKQNEYRAYGYDYPSTGTRIAQLEEALQVIRKMWSEDAPAFEGKYYTVRDATVSPRPDPLPPLLIGGSGRKKVLRLVAQYADMLNFNNVTLDEHRELLGVLAEHCQAVGRDPAQIRQTYAAECVALAKDPMEVARVLAESPFQNSDKLAGTPEESAAKIQAFADLGVETFILRFPDFPHTGMAELFIKEVLPRF
jgi:alkanesulfonate monooxygenase SsuD/methylene tetrahydromethanopterin reductase-like flavin-dependent oxidoreductase (luciferase family)